MSALPLLLTLALALLTPALSTLTPLAPSAPLLQSFGSAHTTLTFLLSIPSSNQAVSSSLTLKQSDVRPVITAHTIHLAQLDDTSYNVSVSLECDAWVGHADFTLTIDLFDTAQGRRVETLDVGVDVLGVTIYTVNGDGAEVVVSGDDGSKVTYGSYLEALLPPRLLKVFSYGAGGVAGVDVAGLQFSVRDFEGGEAGKGSFLVGDGVYVTADGEVALVPRKYRVGSGMVMVGVEWTELEVDGEVFETEFVVVMGRNPEPPAVVETEGVVMGLVEGEGVWIELEMFNLGGLERMWARGGGWVFEGSVSGLEEGKVRLERVEGEGSGEREVVIRGDGGEGEVEVIMTGLVLVRVADSAGGSAVAGGEDSLEGVWWKGPWGVIVGVVAAVLVLVAVGGVVLRARWSGRAADREESSLSAMARVPFEGNPMYVARDVYGRGSLHLNDV